MTQLKLPRSVIIRALALLPMLCTVAEISQLMDVPDRTLRDWLAFHGAPHTRDKKQHIWINGTRFAEWVNNVRNEKNKAKVVMAENEAYCLSCNRPVKIANPVKRPLKGRLILIKGRCPRCGSIINRGDRLLTHRAKGENKS